MTIFKKVSSGATVGRSARPGARGREPGPSTRPVAPDAAAFIVMGAVSELCASSFQTLLCSTVASPPGAAGTVSAGTAAAAAHQELTSAATGDQRRTEIEAGGAFVKLFALAESVSELTPLRLISSQ